MRRRSRLQRVGVSGTNAGSRDGVGVPLNLGSKHGPQPFLSATGRPGVARAYGSRRFGLRSIKLPPEKAWLITSYIVAYLIVLTSFCLVLLKFPQFLYVGRDGDFALWVSNTYRKWAGALDVTAINAYQGMVSTLIPINPYFDPGQWVFWLHWSYGPKLIASYTVYFCEVVASTFAIGLALSFSRLFSFVTSIWLALLLFPPFNFVFALQGWLATAPFYGHLLGLSNLILICFIYIGSIKTRESGVVRLFVYNATLATAMLALGLVALLVAPFYNAGMLMGTAIFGAVIFLSSCGRAQMVWRGAAAVFVVMGFYVLGLFRFYLAEMAFSNRIDSLQPRIHLPFDLSSAALADAKLKLCNWGVACDHFPGWPLHFGSYWLHVAIIFGGLALWLRAPRPLSRIGLFGSATWLALLMI